MANEDEKSIVRARAGAREQEALHLDLRESEDPSMIVAWAWVHVFARMTLFQMKDNAKKNPGFRRGSRISRRFDRCTPAESFMDEWIRT
ncbi:MAG: hypothetical protein KF800_20080 [Lysobacter sp.]|nr:hypothetical protein [Lysobacter sp.]